MTNSHPYEIEDRDLVARVLAWRDQDPDAETRAELDALLAAADEPGLRDRFDSRIGFGTAGLRGELGAGPNRMNRVLVAQAAAGIAAYLKNIGGKSVVIGYDARINSDVFARDSAAIFAGAGLDVLLFDGYVPTPVLAFATKSGTAQADGSTRPYDIGVMVTASHNPPRDNGYKVYAGSLGGSQIIAPVDKLIAEQINLAAASLSFESIPKSESFTVGGGEIREAYVKRASELATHTEGASLRVTFTAMHGVGWDTAARVFASAGLPQPLPVAAQTEPDGSFPTVAFPNPEEPGALDLAIEQANSTGSDLIIALDPDADRLAVAVPDPDSAAGWTKLTGDQVGFILGHRAAQLAHIEGRTGTLACSIASSSALKSVAQHFGLGFQQTLTGFKWISKVPNLIFGFEEALGYCIDPSHTPDKDGITAAVILVSLAQELAAEGKTLAQHLIALEQQFGFTATTQVTLRFASVTQAIKVVAGLRANPPVELLNQALAFEDLALAQSGLPATDGLRFTLTDGRTALIRPSGTEPKLKCYLQATGTSDSGAKHALSELETAFRTLLGA